MNLELSGLEGVREGMREPIQRFAARIQDLAGANAQSLTLIGEIVTPQFDDRRHKARSVLVVNTVDLNMLRELSKEGARWGKSHIAAPLIMTLDYIRASQDSFPLEFLEIRQFHQVLFGPDPFNDLKLEDVHIRLQCEREMKTILLGLRQSLLACGGRDREIGRISEDAATALVRTLRGILWLNRKKEAKPADAVVAEAGMLLGRSLPGIKEALLPQGHRDWDAYRALYADVEALLKERVDASS